MAEIVFLENIWRIVKIMENKDLHQFYKDVIADMSEKPSVLEDIESANDFESLIEKLSKLSHTKGYNFSDDDLKSALNSATAAPEGELNDELLVAVAGGKGNCTPADPNNPNDFGDVSGGCDTDV